ncbi:MAG: radical SAM/SPASM domain-containing protein [Candidatus Thorarchaeota archaeon]
MNKLVFLSKCANVYIHYKLRKYIPFALYLPITFRCNHRCNFCTIWKYKIKNELSLNNIYSIIDDAKRIGIPYISVFGGEPLLRYDLEKIGKKIQSKGIVAALTTNATLIDEKRAKNIVNSFDIVKVSFSGLNKTHDSNTNVKNSFQKASRGLDNLIKFNNGRAQIIIHFLVKKNNFHEIDDFVKKFEKKVDLISFIPENIGDSIFRNKEFINKWKKIKKFSNIGDSDDYIESLTSKKRICDAGKLFFTIYPDGSVNACNSYQNLIIGNIHKKGFYELFKLGLNNNLKRKIKNCDGCYMKCTTEVSQIFRIPFYKLFLKLPRLIRTYKL